MEALDAIMTRRSVRKFEKRQIPDKDLEKITGQAPMPPQPLPFSRGHSLWCRTRRS